MNSGKIDQLADEFQQQILQNAKFLADLGLLNQDLPGLKYALALLRLRGVRGSRKNAGGANPDAFQVSQSFSRNLSELERRLAALQRAQRTTEIDRLRKTAASGPPDLGVVLKVLDTAA